MRKYLTILLIILVGKVSYAATANIYKVTFFNVMSQNQGLSLEACQKMMKTFSFSVAGNNYNFNQNDNPSYHDHQALAFITLSKDSFLEIDALQSKFNDSGKEYTYSSNLSSITYTNPFMIKGVIINQYCKAAYIVLLDDPNGLNSTSVTSVSPTSS